MLAEVDGGWAAALGLGLVAGVRHLAPPSATSSPWGRTGAMPMTTSRSTPEPSGMSAPAERGRARPHKRFRLSPDRSVVLIEVRSTVGPISFGAIGVTRPRRGGHDRTA